MEHRALVFPPGFLWGSAVSAHQVEGNNVHSDWWAWETSPRRRESLKAQGLNPDEYRSGRACDFYHRFEADFDLAKQLRQNAFRLSIEWARIEPVAGRYDEQELAHYRKVLQALRDRKLRSFVTLHHFTSPQWFMQRGGFLRRENISAFVAYARRVAERLSDLVDFWITINEPEIYSSHGYLFGRFPPEHRSWWEFARVVQNLIRAHTQASAAVRGISRKPIGAAYHLNDLQRANIFAHLSREITHYFANEYILNRTVASCDFIGVNYYGHSHISVLGRRMSSKSHHEISDLGWSIHPEGLLRVLGGLKKYRKPIYITENGIADASDTKREKFIRDHLWYLHQAIAQGVDARGYLYWSLLDNFEWAHGFGPRFGLAAVDYKTLRRAIRPSARAYAKICQTNTLTL